MVKLVEQLKGDLTELEVWESGPDVTQVVEILNCILLVLLRHKDVVFFIVHTELGWNYVLIDLSQLLYLPLSLMTKWVLMGVMVMLTRSLIFTRIAWLTVIQELALIPLDFEHFK